MWLLTIVRLFFSVYVFFLVLAVITSHYGVGAGDVAGVHVNTDVHCL